MKSNITKTFFTNADHFGSKGTIYSFENLGNFRIIESSMTTYTATKIYQKNRNDVGQEVVNTMEQLCINEV